MIYGPFERMVAFRYLRARRQEGFISVIAIFSLLGIALGVATLIITMSVMNGFRAELLGRILGFNGHLGVYSIQGPLPDYDQVAQRIKGVPGVVMTTPIVEGQVLASARGNSAGVMVRAMRKEDVGSQPLLGSSIRPEALQQFGDDNVLLGDKLAAKLGLRTGDEITLLSPNGNVTALGTVPRIKTYRVAGLFSLGMYEYDSGIVIMPLDAAQTYFRVPNAATSLEVFVDDPDEATAIGRAIATQLGAGVNVIDWQRRNSSFFDAVKVERNVMFLILTLIILVAAFNIISSMIMLVKDKGRDIAILRTMGATRGMIMRIFVLSGASIGVVGTVAGFALGVSFATNIEAIRRGIESIIGTDLFHAEIYFLTQIPARVYASDVITVVSMAFILSFLATLYPSWRAARLDPVEALRYE